MNNFTSMFVAVLEKVELLTKDEAEKLVKELHVATLPDNYKSASVLVEDIFKKAEVKSLGLKTEAHTVVKDIQARLADLEANVNDLANGAKSVSVEDVTNMIKSAIDPIIEKTKVVPKPVVDTTK